MTISNSPGENNVLGLGLICAVSAKQNINMTS